MSRFQFLILPLILVGFVGLSLAIAFADPETFLLNVGLLALGSATGGLVAIFVVNGVIGHRQKVADDETKRRLLTSIGHDAVGAISRLSWGPGVAPTGGFRFQGHELNDAWYYEIETGRLDPKGFKNEVYTQHVETVHPMPGPTLPPRRVVLTNDGMDLDIALLMVTRALGRSYARLDLFEAEEIPINDLEHASQVLRDGRQANALDDFQSASLMAALTQAVEKSGVLLHQIGAFTTRERPKDALE